MTHKAAKKSYDGGQLIQELEPRVLLSADHPGAGIDDAWANDIERVAAHVSWVANGTYADEASTPASAEEQLSRELSRTRA